MQRYSYTALKANGEKISNEILASNVEEVVLRLKHQGLFVINIREKKPLEKFIKGKKWSQKAIIKFSFQMRTLIEAGISMHKIIDLLIKGDKNNRLLKEIKEYITQGKPLSKALEYVGFPKLAVTLVRVGEASGDLAQVFKDIQIHYEKKRMLRQKLIQTSIYPSFVLILLFAFFILAINFIFPTFVKVFESMNVEVPYILQFFEGINKSNIGLTIGIVVFSTFITMTVALKKIKVLRYQVEKLIWQIMGRYIVYGGYLYARVFSVIALLLEAGIPLVTALELSEKLWNNLYLEKKTRTIINSLKNGEDIATSFSKEGLGTVVFFELLKVGSMSGDLDQMFFKSAKYYSELVMQKFKKIEACIEPILMSFIGISVGAIVLLIMMPLFDAMQAMGSI